MATTASECNYLLLYNANNLLVLYHCVSANTCAVLMLWVSQVLSLKMVYIMRCICFYSGQVYSMPPMPTDVATTSAPVPQNDLDVVLAVAAIALAVIVLVVIAVVAIGFAKKKITKRCVHSCTTYCVRLRLHARLHSAL